MEETKERTGVQIQTEYQKLCAIAGDKQYRYQVLEAELGKLNEHLFALNQEYQEFEKRANIQNGGNTVVHDILPMPYAPAEIDPVHIENHQETKAP